MIRRIRQQALFSAISFAGLSLGFACIVVITFWINTEQGYDHAHRNVQSIYRVHRYFYDQNGAENLHLPYVAPVIAPLLRQEFHEIQHISRSVITDIAFKVDQQAMPVANVSFSEPDLLHIFTFEGLPNDTSLLVKPLTAIISDETAEKFFNTTQAIGKTLEISDEKGVRHVIEITGVFKTWQRNSHFRPNVVVSFSTYEASVAPYEMTDWSSNNYETYALMSALPDKLDDRLDAFIDKYLDHGTNYTKIRLEKLSDIHFNWYSSRSFVYILISIAVLILVLATINFMNLNAASFIKHIKFIQIRQIIGAPKRILLVQLAAESVIFCLIALMVALYLAYLSLPLFNKILTNPIESDFGNFFKILAFLLMATGTGIVAIVSPAWMIAATRLSRSGAVRQGNGRTVFRNGLIVFQFVVSVTLLISFFFISKQLSFLRNKELGLDKENVLVIPATPLLIEKFDIFRQQLTENPQIMEVSASKRVPSEGLWDSNGARLISGAQATPIGFRIANLRIDQHFLDLYGIKLLAGRNFYENIAADTGYLVNEELVKKLGWKSNEEAVGQIIEYGGMKASVIGVVGDFHYESLHNPISPVIMYYDPSDFNRVAIRMAAGDPLKTLAFIEERWHQYNNVGYTFQYEFLTDKYRNLYKTEENIRSIMVCCLVLAMVIAVLGLVGVSVFLIERRTKEIGIRKVNGARTGEVLLLLNRDFFRWVGLALIIACPLAWFAIHTWLQSFAYRTALSWWVFAAAGLTSILIAMLTVSWQSWHAARRNPVEALRYE